VTEPSLFFDSSAWLAYFLESSIEIKGFVEDSNLILTSAVSLFEIKRKLKKLKFEDLKIQEVMSFIKTNSVLIDLTSEICEFAADNYDLATVDSLIYSSSINNSSLLITLDKDFKNLDFVKVIE